MTNPTPIRRPTPTGVTSPERAELAAAIERLRLQEKQLAACVAAYDDATTAVHAASR